MNESTTNMRTEEAIKEKIKESRFESINGKDLMEMDLPGSLTVEYLKKLSQVT